MGLEPTISIISIFQSRCVLFTSELLRNAKCRLLKKTPEACPELNRRARRTNEMEYRSNGILDYWGLNPSLHHSSIPISMGLFQQAAAPSQLCDRAERKFPGLRKLLDQRGRALSLF
jgi:hypothetical protein